MNLYRHYDDAGRLLYIGVSLSALIRLHRHKQAKAPWFDQISSVTIERCRDRKTALLKETRAIRKEKPAHNIHKQLREEKKFLRLKMQNKKPIVDLMLAEDAGVSVREIMRSLGRLGGIAASKNMTKKQRSERARKAGSAPKRKRGGKNGAAK